MYEVRFVATLINLNHPGKYIHYSILSISLANLLIIAMMVLIFGLAVILPFPKGKRLNSKSKQLADHLPIQDTNDPPNKMWTARLRAFISKYLTLSNLIPDEQPAYVTSWIYVFGVATLAALFMVIISGLILAIGGVNWWHESNLGHFFNSMHLWSIELFMAFMVIHLWGKFWMSAWRGKRMLTWMTGVLAFSVSILEAFTGYLSQQNFDSQWISTNGKDAINATGLGSFFNLMNFGQMITWHIVLIPLVLVALVGLHIILVRIRGVVHPVIKTNHSKASRKHLKKIEALKWKGPTRQYDILKEGFVATLIVIALVLGLAFLLSSPDDPPVTIQTWSTLAPADFMATTLSELNGTSETANYGPPYNNGTHNLQKLGPSWQLLGGIRQKINPSKSFVITPLTKIYSTNLNVQKALKQYSTSSANELQTWETNYSNALKAVQFKNHQPVLRKGNYGPISTIINYELISAQSGALDTSLLAQQAFYGSNYTKPLLFIEDGNYFASKAKSQHLYGAQWGVMNETGSYPGQPWMWLYTLWYQIPAFSSSVNIDLIAVYLTFLATILLLMVPLLPGIRSIPKLIPIYKLIWRKWYKQKY